MSPSRHGPRARDQWTRAQGPGTNGPVDQSLGRPPEPQGSPGPHGALWSSMGCCLLPYEPLRLLSAANLLQTFEEPLTSPPQRGIPILGVWVDTSRGGVGTTARPPACVSLTQKNKAATQPALAWPACLLCLALAWSGLGLSCLPCQQQQPLSLIHI